MGLNWEWNKKCGEVEISWERDGEIHHATDSLYQGNAYLIELYEYKDENDEDCYQMQSFMVDEAHAKRLLGVDRKYETYGINAYEKDGYRWDKVILYKGMWEKKKLNRFVNMLTEAFKEITIVVKE